MRFVRRSVSAAISAAVAATVIGPASAQEAAQAGASPDEPAAISLPELSVETEAAPAKRNKKKQTLKNNAASGSSGTSSGVVTTAALPGIVVEGEKVVRSMRDTTTSIGVVTGQQIRDEQIEDLQGALNSQANVVAPKGAGGNNGFAIRGLNSEGLTNNQNPSAAPLISVVIDGATQNGEATRRGARGLWDVEQVEVLRGPQTTLQARNALAGAVFVKTNDPTYKWETIVEGTAGGQDLKSGGFVFNAPIVVGQSALRISGQSFQRNHDISYGNPENNTLDEDVLRTVRGKLLLEPDSLPGLSALFTISRADDRPAVLSVSPPFFERHLDATANLDFRETKTTNYIADVGYDLGAGLSVRSITAYADTETTIGSAPSNSYQRDVTRNGGDFTQDLRLEIENRGNGLSGVVGLFYGSFKYANITFDTIDAASLGLPFPGAITVQDLATDVETESMAAYADLRYRFFDRFVLIGGGRLLKDTVKSSTVGDILPLIAGVSLQKNFSNDFTEALPRLGLTYDLTAEQTVGVTYNKGYRNGYTEFNINTQQFNTVKPEYLDAYELSYRSNWANNTISFNANAFYYDYKNQQVAFEEDLFGMLPYPVSYILNADSSHAYGAEFEARWRPIAPLQLYGSLGLMRTKFDTFVSPAADFTGNEFPDAPAYTIAAGGMYRHASGWFAGANVRYTDGYYSGGDLGNTALRFVDSYTLVDARVGYEWTNYTLTLFAKNLFNEDYVTSIGQNARQATVGDTQLIGLTLRGTF
ncbi:TonB-dependent receptor [Hyphomicrobium sulfonivorans]|uniref:TonB-dependent receptor n=1 Tax=Hyphomicrobium sulfonivorans TaxID=121290 RepID=UPI000838EAC8|nr:TonB-dependent receptor [Hyphomicrobium sulfonivorans]